MENVRKLVTERHTQLKQEIDKVGKKRIEQDKLSEFYELDNFLNSFDLLHLVIKSQNEARQQGFGDGYNEGANDMCSRM